MKLMRDRILEEDICVMSSDITSAYVKVGKMGPDLIRGAISFSMPITVCENKSKAGQQYVPKEDKEIKAIRDRCYNELYNLARQRAEASGINVHNLIPLEGLRKMAEELPTTENEFLSLEHVTEHFNAKHGAHFLLVTQRFAEERNKLEADRIKAKMEQDIRDAHQSRTFAPPKTSYSAAKSYSANKRKWPPKKGQAGKKRKAGGWS